MRGFFQATRPSKIQGVGSGASWGWAFQPVQYILRGGLILADLRPAHLHTSGTLGQPTCAPWPGCTHMGSPSWKPAGGAEEGFSLHSSVWPSHVFQISVPPSKSKNLPSRPPSLFRSADSPILRQKNGTLLPTVTVTYMSPPSTCRDCISALASSSSTRPP